MLQLNAKLGLVLLSASLIAPAANATVITFGTGGTTGFTGGGTNSVTVNNAAGNTGLTATVTAGTTTTCTGTCLITTAVGGYGVNDGEAGDSASIDGGGAFLDTLSLSFNNTVRITSITFSLWGGSDDVQIYNGGALALTYNTNVATASVNLAGTDFQFRAPGSNDDFLLQSITFTEIPEPATFGMAGIAMLGLGFAARKKMRRS